MFLLVSFSAAVENLGNLTMFREKLGKVEKVGENVFYLWCVTAIAMFTE